MCFYYFDIFISLNLNNNFNKSNFTASMSNLANYSPYNKTYKFLLFQNQAYHQKNKKTARPCVRTNLRYSSENKSLLNPQNSQLLQKSPTRSTQRCDSPSHSQTRSMLISSQSMREKDPKIKTKKLVIHKNVIFEKFREKRIERENCDLVKRLVRTSCEIIKNKSSQKSFGKHLKYKDLRKKFDKEGNRKSPLVMGNSSLLCPTLQDFNQSGLGDKFLQCDLSMSANSSRAYKRKSNFM